MGVVAVVATTAMATSVASASAAVTVGADTSQPPNFGGIFCNNVAQGCSFVNLGVASGTVSAPFDGVVVRWRVWGDSHADQFRLQVARPVGAGAFTGAGSSAPQSVAPGAERVFPTRISVKQGDQLAIFTPGGASEATGGVIERRVNLLPADIISFWSPALSDGESPGRPPTGGPVTEQNYLYNADVEPDCDQDGFGDESQDADTESCQPVPPTADTDPPETTITKGAPNKLHKRQVKFKFESDEAGSTFECKFDKKKFKPCSSPRNYKRLDDGKHKFKVFATDPAGNAGAPAKDRFKVAG